MRPASTSYAYWFVLLAPVLSLACSSSAPGKGAADKDDAGDVRDGGDSSNSNGGSGSTVLDGGDTDGEAPKIPGLESLSVTPAKKSIVDDGVKPGEKVTFKALGTFGNKEEDVSDKVAWSLEDAKLGTIKNGVFTSAGLGGTTKVYARALGIEGQASLEIKLEVQTKTDGAPAGIVELFAADPSKDEQVDSDTLRIIYPSDETMFPRNLQRVDHQWRAGASLDRFEVRFESPVALVRYYTADKHFLPDEQGWKWLADTHAGRSLTMTVRGASSAAPGKITSSKPITLYYSESEVPGALYYWSTGAQGVLKAKISSEVAMKFFTDPTGTDTTCVSCHTVSRNGQKLSAAYGGEILREISVPDRTLLIPSSPTTKGAAYGWGTFSPDASRLLYANNGLLTMLDADKGDKLFAVDLAGKFATHPDWSPSGKYVAVAYGSAKLDNKNAQGTSIARLPVKSDGTLDAPKVLLASTGTMDTSFFPSYSPDSKWIAFVRATGKSKDNVTSTLYLLPAEGGEPIELTRLTQRVRNEDGITGIGNSMPTWAPSTKPGVFWLAFSSLRAYGDVLAGGRDQLWAAAIDPTKIASGKDPSYAAFWLPFQDIAEGNHRAFWAIDTEADCPGGIEICDSLDNDCDGVVDEDCCTPSDEVCGDHKDNNCDEIVDEGCCIPKTEICDGKDNDCNLVVDEGCGCSSVEICNNDTDDDCDMNVDEGCVQ